MAVEIATVDYNDPLQGQQLIALLDEYARDRMGGGQPLSDFSRSNLLTALQSVPGAFSLLASVEGQPAGFCNCLAAFSTFHCKPLVNIHDLAVSAGFRGKGVARQLLSAVDDIARERGCCKVTLEVLEGNHAARAAYLKHGYQAYSLDPDLGIAQFWQNEL